MSPKDSLLNITARPPHQTQALPLHSPHLSSLLNLCSVLGLSAVPSGAVGKRHYLSHIACLLLLWSTSLLCVLNDSCRLAEEPRHATNFFPLYSAVSTELPCKVVTRMCLQTWTLSYTSRQSPHKPVSFNTLGWDCFQSLYLQWMPKILLRMEYTFFLDTLEQNCLYILIAFAEEKYETSVLALKNILCPNTINFASVERNQVINCKIQCCFKGNNHHI